MIRDPQQLLSVLRSLSAPSLDDAPVPDSSARRSYLSHVRDVCGLTVRDLSQVIHRGSTTIWRYGNGELVIPMPVIHTLYRYHLAHLREDEVLQQVLDETPPTDLPDDLGALLVFLIDDAVMDICWDLIYLYLHPDGEPANLMSTLSTTLKEVHPEKYREVREQTWTDANPEEAFSDE